MLDVVQITLALGGKGKLRWGLGAELLSRWMRQRAKGAWEEHEQGLRWEATAQTSRQQIWGGACSSEAEDPQFPPV